MTSIPLIVPEQLVDLADKIKVSNSNSLEIQTYKRLTKKIFVRLQKESAILVAGIEEFSKLWVSNSPKNSGQDMKGKVLLLTDKTDLSDYPFATQRGMDISAKESGEGLWNYKINKFMEDLAYDRRITILKEADIKHRKDLDNLNEIGLALSTEKDLDKLLDLILLKSREMTWSDAGTLYMLESDPNIEDDPDSFFKNKKMRFQVAQNDTRDLPFRSFLADISISSIYGYVALTQGYLNFSDVYVLDSEKEYGWGGRDFDAVSNYRTMSMLTVPLVNWRGETIAVIQLINSKKSPDASLDDPKNCTQFIKPFNDHDVRIALSIASQASIAIQNAQLVNSIKGLFDGFIAASVKAIESRDPTTSGHSQRVAILTVELAKLVDKDSSPIFRDVSFNEDNLQEIRYASLLHDFGKIGVRENVLVKAKKLFPYELQAVKDRFGLIRRTLELNFSNRELELLKGKEGKLIKELMEATQKERDDKLKEIEDYLNFILQCNEPTVLAQGGFDMLNDIAARNFRNWDGVELAYLNDKELISLSVPKGSLNENDRKEIESHVTHTYKFLNTIPWTPDLRKVADIAYAHHEKLDGTGYPQKLTAAKIPIQAKMMSISDIFDALTAMDRPYKKALPAERALNILKEETKAAHVDGDLLTIFIDSEIYKIVLQGQ